MTADSAAKKFLAVLFVFLAVNLVWSATIVAFLQKRPVIALALSSTAIYGTLSYFLARRSKVARIVLGLTFIAVATWYVSQEVRGAPRMDVPSHIRMIVGALLGVALLIWRPIVACTQKKPNQTPEPTPAAGRGSS